MKQLQQTDTLEVKGLSLKSPEGRIYEEVSLSLKKGQVGAIYGSDGSGKTCLLLTLCGRMRFMGGTGNIFGFDLKKQYRKVRDLSQITIITHINEVPENLKVRDIVSAELQSFGKHGNKRAVQAYLDEWKFSDHAETRYRDLDSNECCYFGILLAMIGDPKLLLVDDIQTGLTQHRSLSYVEMFKKLAVERDMAVLFACSEYDVACKADAVLVMSEKAEEQRKAVLNAKGDEANTPVMGTANRVQVSDAIDLASLEPKNEQIPAQEAVAAEDAEPQQVEEVEAEVIPDPAADPEEGEVA